MAQILEYATAVISVLLVTYPFTALVKYVKNIEPHRLNMCTEASPCTFMTMYPDRVNPRSGPDFIQIRSDVERPVSVAWDSSVGRMHMYNRVQGRADMLFFGYLAGGFYRQAPALADPSQAESVVEVCVVGFCVSLPGWGFSFFRSETASLRKFRQRVHESSVEYSKFSRSWLHNHSATAEAVAAVGAAMEEHKQFWIVGFTRWVTQAMCNALQILMINSNKPGQGASRTDLFPSALCPNMSKSEMEILCHHQEVRQKFQNTLATEVSLNIYLAVTSLWVLSLILHEILVLAGQRDVISLSVSFVTLTLQAMSAGSGFLAAAGAIAVFQAPTGTQQCSCYYQLPIFDVAIMIGTPCAQLCLLIRHRVAFAKGALFGDYLLSKTYHVPQSVAQQNPGWHALRIIAHQSTDAGISSNPDRAQTPSKKVSEFIQLMMMERTLTCIFGLFCYLPYLVVSVQLFARLMAFLACQQTLFFRVLSSLPFLINCGHVFYGIYVLRFRLRADFFSDLLVIRFRYILRCIQFLGFDVQLPSLKSGYSTTTLKRTEGMVGIYIDQLLGCLLFLPPWLTLGSGTPSPAALLVMTSYWSVGGLILSFAGIRGLYHAVGVEAFKVLRLFEMYVVGPDESPSYWYWIHTLGEHEWMKAFFEFCLHFHLLHKGFSEALPEMLKQEIPETFAHLQLDNRDAIRSQFEHDIPLLHAHWLDRRFHFLQKQISTVDQKLSMLVKQISTADQRQPLLSV